MTNEQNILGYLVGFEIFAMREVNINPTDILKKDLITSTIMHKVAESIDPTITMISFFLAIQGHKA